MFNYPWDIVTFFINFVHILYKNTSSFQGLHLEIFNCTIQHLLELHNFQVVKIYYELVFRYFILSALQFKILLFLVLFDLKFWRKKVLVRLSVLYLSFLFQIKVLEFLSRKTQKCDFDFLCHTILHQAIYDFGMSNTGNIVLDNLLSFWLYRFLQCTCVSKIFEN